MQDPNWCYLKIIRVALFYIHDFERHHIWWSLVQPLYFQSSPDVKNYSDWMNKCTVSCQTVWSSPLYFDEWMLLRRISRIKQTTNTSDLQHLYGITNHTALPTASRQKHSPNCDLTLLTRQFLTAMQKPTLTLCPDSLWTPQPWVRTQYCWLFLWPLLYSWTS